MPCAHAPWPTRSSQMPILGGWCERCSSSKPTKRQSGETRSVVDPASISERVVNRGVQVRLNRLYGEWTRAEAEQHGLPVLSSRPWETLPDRVIAAIG